MLVRPTTPRDRQEHRPDVVNSSMELLTAEDVSELTGLSVETLAQWRSQKKHIPFLKVGRLVRYDREEVDRYFETCRVSVSQTRRQK